ncbi:unnamed protein product [Colias eurytheme]|nr:unnamed protein product [Colias eurytheme]
MIAQEAKISHARPMTTIVTALAFIAMTSFPILSPAKLRNEVEIVGVPETPNENPAHTFRVISQKLGIPIEESDLDFIIRVGSLRKYSQNIDNTEDNSQQPSRPLIARFLSRNKRDEFLKVGHRSIETARRIEKIGSIQKRAPKKPLSLQKQVSDDIINTDLFEKCRLSFTTQSPPLPSQEVIEINANNMTTGQNEKVKLEELQLRQKLMGEQNNKRKEMLSKALADSAQTGNIASKHVVSHHVSKYCKKWHHSLLHIHDFNKKEERDSNIASQSSTTTTANTASSVCATITPRAYLKIIEVDVFLPKGYETIMALMDEGSTVILLDSSVANRIGLNGDKMELVLQTVGGGNIVKKDSQVINLTVKGVN